MIKNTIRPRQTKGFVQAKDIVDNLLKKYGLTSDTYAIFNNIWDKELGKLSKKIKLIGKKDGCLLVQVDNPVYMQELRVRKKEFVNKINGHFGKKIVDNIKIMRISLTKE